MSDRPMIILTVGLPGSGKSSWADSVVANDHQWVNICKDDIRRSMGPNRPKESCVIDEEEWQAEQALDRGLNVILSSTHLNPAHLKRIKAKFGQRAIIETKSFLDVSVEECLRRDLLRPNPVGKDVILDMYYRWLCEPAHQDPNLLKAFICDLDGTLADNSWRSPYDASKCDQDPVRAHVQLVVQALVEKGVYPIFVSGREELYRPQTQKFLEKAGLQGYTLYMRATGDNRKDYVIKEELYRQHIQPHFHIACCFDDRGQVIRLWRRLGLAVLDCGLGVEF